MEIVYYLNSGKGNWMKYIMTAIAILSFSVTSIATPISGDISGILSSANSPYEVVGDLRVPQGESLEIQAGCYFDFQGYYTFIVDTSATLRAIGNATDSITFTTADTLVGWHGLRFLSASDSCELAYCIIEWGFIPFESFCSLYYTKNGAGIFIDDMNFKITYSNIRNNIAFENYGGGIYASNATITIQECILINNYAGFGGSGICCDTSTAEIVSNSINDNDVFYYLGGVWGGAILCSFSDVLICDNIISNNLSDFSGGGVILECSNGDILNNTFDANGSRYAGGGLLCYRSHSLVKNNIFYNNYSYEGNGGGLAVSDGELDLINNTFWKNQAYYNGGAIVVLLTETDSIANCIFLENTSMYGEDNLYLFGDSSHVYYSCIEGGWPGEGNIDANPLFADPDNGDFHITWANYPIEDETKSPCIDTGAPWSPLDPDSTHADMGALYFNQWISDIDDPIALPERVQLHQNYPNPFNASTLISYELPVSSEIKLDIYDILGRHIATLEDGTQPAGSHQVVWNADELASGVYFYKLQAKDYIERKRMVLVK